MNKPKSHLPKIVHEQIVIDDNWVRKNRGSQLLCGQTVGTTVFVFRYVLDKNLTVYDEEKKRELQRAIDKINADEAAIIAHESQHVHNNTIGYSFLSNSDNVYECMMLCLADEMSAMLAGYLQKNKNIDLAMVEMVNNLSGDVRKHYISDQFSRHFRELQQSRSQHFYQDKTKLFEHKFDSPKIQKILNWYFTIDGQNVMQNMSKKTSFVFRKFMMDVKSDINSFIANQIASMENSGKQIG